MDFDFALVRLAERLDFVERDNVRPICLPRASDSHPEIGAQVNNSGTLRGKLFVLITDMRENDDG